MKATNKELMTYDPELAGNLVLDVIKDINPDNIQESTEKIEKMVLTKLGTFMAFRRNLRHISVRDLNKLSHVSIAVITDLENGKSMPRVETLIRLALALKIDFNDIFDIMKIPYAKQRSHYAHAQLASVIVNFGFNKDAVDEIMKFIEFVEYKHKNENNRK